MNPLLVKEIPKAFKMILSNRGEKGEKFVFSHEKRKDYSRKQINL